MCFSDYTVAEVADCAKGRLVRFAQNLPAACLDAKVGLSPKTTRLLVHIMPEEPDNHAFKDPIFMGGGAYSVRDCGLLLGKVNQALSLLSGMQQNGGMGTAFDEDEDREGAERIEAIVRDVAMALTGKKIDFTTGQT